MLWGTIIGIILCFGCLSITALGIGVWYQYEDELLALVQDMEPTSPSRSVANGEEEEKPVAIPTRPTGSTRGGDTDAPPPVSTPLVETPIPETGDDFPALVDISALVPAEIDQRPITARAYADLEQLLNTDFPANDYFEVTERLGQVDLGARTIQGDTYSVGNRQEFFVDGGRITAVLVAETANTRFWIEEELNLDPADVAAAANRMQEEYFAPMLAIFGSYWDPGIDNDPQITFLHISESSGTELGFFVSDNQFPRSLYSRSNEQEMVYMNMGELRLGSDLYYATLVHEFQHLIHWHVDPNESLWLNEGLSQLAEIYLGFEDTAGTREFLSNPETQLNTWEYEEENVLAHYAAAYLLSVYFWEQLGDEALQELTHHPANGLAGIQAVLEQFAPDRSLFDFLGDWAVANYLDHPDFNPRYGYQHLDLNPISINEHLRSGNELEGVYSLNQYGTHYIDMTDLRGMVTIRFAGDTLADLTDGAPQSGTQFWFAPPVDETNARLTASFDLTNLDRATLKYNVWFDLESEYDFAYVSISTDGGLTWETLLPSFFQTGEFGPAYNGKSANRTESNSGGWLKETISLNQYVGNVVQIRFEVLTDSGIINPGFAIDDIAIPEYNYLTTIDDGAEGWVAEGFVTTSWNLPQLWSVQWIAEGPQPAVTKLRLNELNQGEWTIDVGKGGGVLIIMPQTPFIFTPANYWLQIEQ